MSCGKAIRPVTNGATEKHTSCGGAGLSTVLVSLPNSRPCSLIQFKLDIQKSLVQMTQSVFDLASGCCHITQFTAMNFPASSLSIFTTSPDGSIAFKITLF